MIDNIPWYIALPLAAILWVFYFRMRAVDDERVRREQEAARIATTGDADPQADRFLHAIAADR